MPLTIEAQKSIFNVLKCALEKLSPPMVVSKNKEGVFELIGNKARALRKQKGNRSWNVFLIGSGAERNGEFLFFSTLLPSSGFYRHHPSYEKVPERKDLFYFKKSEEVNGKELAALLKKGVKAWKTNNYMD